ncbi:MAG: hypothetical protein P4L76_18035 [Beijerinckiaceae bacterium]|nr:hypothetical protein [Beijerinckiaceae bacterium]
MSFIQLSMGRTRVTFDEVKAVGTRYEVVDGKKRRRQKTFYQTVNPFNKNADGSVKTRAEVYVAVKAEAHAWENTLP